MNTPGPSSAKRPVAVVTTGFVLLVVVLQGVLWTKNGFGRISLASLQQLGGLVPVADLQQPQLQGLFDLWRGEWWRVFVTQLLFDDLLTAVLCVASLVWAGWRLEQRWGGVRMGLFLCGALVVCAVPAVFIESRTSSQTFVRINGCLGLLFAVATALLWTSTSHMAMPRRRAMAFILANSLVVLGCLTWYSFRQSGLLDDRTAAITGILYGWLAATLIDPHSVRRRGIVLAFAAAHLLLPVGLLWAMAPASNPHYHWWLARQSDGEQRIEHYQQAIRLNRTFAPLRQEMALAQLDDGNLQDAWQTTLNGLDHVDDPAELQLLARGLWLLMDNTQRTQAARNLHLQYRDFAEVALQLQLPAEAVVAQLLQDGETEKAWAFVNETLARQARKQQPAGTSLDDFSAASPGQTVALARLVWDRLDSTGGRRQALEVLAEVHGLTRRTWQRELIPPGDLLPYCVEIGERIWAWESACELLTEQPADPVLLRTAADIWQSLPTPNFRAQAEYVFRQQFGNNRDDLRLLLGMIDNRELHAVRVDAADELPAEWLHELETNTPPAPPVVDEHAPDSALLGRRL